MKTRYLEVSEYIEEKRAALESYLEKLIPKKESPFSELYDAARYSLLGGGKRLRPILTIATAEALAGHNQPISMIPPCAIELVHTYSLIHDDLPGIDNDDIRRGKPTLHKAYNEGHAILTGDYLLTKAFELIAEDTQTTPEQRLQLITCLATFNGGEGMVGGQILDHAASGKPLDLTTLRLIHLNKTAKPIICAVEFGAILGNATEEQRQGLNLFATQIGLAFQIIDDILDIATDGTDTVNNKTSYIAIMGPEQAHEAAEFLYQNALGSLEQLNMDTHLLAAIASRFIDRES